MATRTAPTLADIEAARARIDGIARVTPVFGSETLSRMTGRSVLLKAENLQRTGSFKMRGAVNKIHSLSEAERAAGVVAATAGNHGQAVAWAAREARIAATIFMPRDTPMAKVEATRTYGARIESGAETLDGRVRGGAGVRERDRRDLPPRLRGRARDRRPGDDRARARRAGARGGHRRDPGRRRRARVGDRDRAARAAARAPARRRPGRGVRAARRWHRARLHDRRGDRGQEPGRADLGDPPRAARRHRHGLRRGDLRGDRAARRAHEAAGRGRGRGGRRGAARAARSGAARRR